MEEVGVEAVVKGLSSFLGDMKDMDSAISSLISPTNILGSTFDFLGNALSNVGSFIVNTLAHAFGELLADAIEWVSTQIKDLIANTIEAGSEFQKLEIRLNNLNFNDLTDDQKTFANAQDLAIEKTKEQFSWLQRIAAQTPYDNTDISNIYTLARGYSFADDQARSLTKDIIDFTSGMGLGNTEMVRIIKNFGQMNQLGKVMQRDLNDLATGAFVPVNDILAKVRLNTGLAGGAFDDFMKTTEGTQAFMTAFSQVVEQRFSGSAAKMSRTVEAATDNLKDFVKSIFGLNVIKPILDVIGSRLAQFMDELTSESRWNSFVSIANTIGKTAVEIIDKIVGLAPSASNMADAVVNAMTGISNWLDAHKDDIVGFVKESVYWFNQELIPSLKQAWQFLFGSESQTGAVQKFGEWLKSDFLPFIQSQVIPGIKELFDAITGKGKNTSQDKNNNLMTDIADFETPLVKIVDAIVAISTAIPPLLELLGAIGKVIATAFGSEDPKTFADFIEKTVIPAIQSLTKFINENREGFALLFKAILALEVIAFIVGLVFSLITGLASLALAFGALVVIGTIVGVITLQFKYFELAIRSFIGAVQAMVTTTIQWFQNWKNNIITTINDIIVSIKNKDWPGVGRAIIDGITNYIRNNVWAIANILQQAATNAMSAIRKTLGIRSPSTVMWDIGEYMMKGFANGISDTANLAVRAMTAASNSIAVPAMSASSAVYANAMAPGTVTNKSTINNYNLSINSQSPKEPIIQDFNTMQALQG